MSEAFQAFPTSIFSCVTSNDDTDKEIGCKQCNPNRVSSLFAFINTAFSFNQKLSASVCKLTSGDGLTTAYCSRLFLGNQPQISFSCYQGTFSAEMPLKPKVKIFFSNLLSCAQRFTNYSSIVFDHLKKCEK